MSTCLGLLDDLSFVMMFDSDNVIHPQPQVHNLRRDLQEVFRVCGVQVDCLSSSPVLQSVAVNGSLKIDIAHGVPTEMLYDKSVLRVLFNLLSNALKFNSIGGSLEVFVNFVPDKLSVSKGGSLVVRVANSVDKCLDLVHINKSFQKYLRLLPSGGGTPTTYTPTSLTPNTSDKRQRAIERLSSTLVATSGLGLGLYVAYNIVQSLGGLLECSSSDSQACFSFSLPVDLVHTETDTAILTSPKQTNLWAHVTTSDVSSRHVAGLRQKVASSQSADSLLTKSKGTTNSGASINKRGRILVVDDSPICRKVLIRALESNGYTTDFACDGQVSSFYHFYYIS